MINSIDRPTATRRLRNPRRTPATQGSTQALTPPGVCGLPRRSSRPRDAVMPVVRKNRRTATACAPRLSSARGSTNFASRSASCLHRTSLQLNPFAGAQFCPMRHPPPPPSKSTHRIVLQSVSLTQRLREMLHSPAEHVSCAQSASTKHEQKPSLSPSLTPQRPRAQPHRGAILFDALASARAVRVRHARLLCVRRATRVRARARPLRRDDDDVFAGVAARGQLWPSLQSAPQNELPGCRVSMRQ